MTTHIAFHAANYTQGFGIIAGDTIISETITESGSNQQSAASSRPYVTISATVAVWLSFGTNPNATVATSRIYHPANVVTTYGVGIGNKVAVVTA